MRDNLVKQRLVRGETVLGSMVFEFFTPGTPQILRAAGADFAIFDMEHSGVGMETIKMLMAASRGIGLVPMVRVPATEYHFMARALDVGAMGLMVPMVETAEQAKAIVAATRYPPIGRRGAAFGVAHDHYEGGAVADKIEAVNERIFVMAQIETARGAEAVDAIAAVDGIDCVWLGHFDLTNFLGIPGEFQHPRYLEAVEAIVAAARRHGKVAGMMAADVTWARDYRARGYTAIAYGLDHLLLQGALAQGLRALRDELPSSPSQASPERQPS